MSLLPNPGVVRDFVSAARNNRTEFETTLPQLTPNQRKLFLIALRLFREENWADHRLLQEWKNLGGERELNHIIKILKGQEYQSDHKVSSIYEKHLTPPALEKALDEAVKGAGEHRAPPQSATYLLLKDVDAETTSIIQKLQGFIARGDKPDPQGVLLNWKEEIDQKVGEYEEKSRAPENEAVKHLLAERKKQLETFSEELGALNPTKDVEAYKELLRLLKTSQEGVQKGSERKSKS